ncbi:MAG: hypothetical protein K2Z81_22695 [Cyanobacteria bacterium]|nr:hypothetical protein [Cyanobacteriota bacterium]
MTDKKRIVNLDEDEASLALHALRFYMNAKGREVSANSEHLEAKLDQFLIGTSFVVTEVESVASILGARGGTKGGVSTSDAKRAAAAANGAKGGRPPKPNLFIKFAKAVWHEPDPKLLNELYTLIGNNTWLPDERGDEKEGPYVRVHVPEVNSRLEKLLSNSLNVFEWDEKGIYRFCNEHANDAATQLRADDTIGVMCTICSKQAYWIY